MRVLIVDDHRLLLEGLANLLDANGIEVVGMAKDGLQAINLANTLKPDLILMDIRMPNCDGLEATRRIKALIPEIRIVMLTTSTDEEDLFDAIRSGATGYLLKSMDTEDLLDVLNQAQKGTPPFAPGLAAKLLNEFARLSVEKNHESEKENPPAEEDLIYDLTSRQVEVLKLVAQGLTYKEVGAKLSLSPRTIKYHMAEIMERLHMENRAQVLAYATKKGLTT